MNLFWERGYEATSVADLVSAVGIGRQSLYGAFGDKKQLFEEAFALYARNELEPFLVILESREAPARILHQVFDHIRELAARRPQTGCMAVRTAAVQCDCDSEMAMVTREQLKRVETAMSQVLERAIASGDVPTDLEPRALARTILAAFNGMAAVSTILEDPAAMAEDVLATLEAMLFGVEQVANARRAFS